MRPRRRSAPSSSPRNRLRLGGHARRAIMAHVSAGPTNAPRIAEVDVSIVVPCFNHGLYLAEAIASAQACHAPSCEVIVVNDGSDDPATIAAIGELRRDRIQ